MNKNKNKNQQATKQKQKKQKSKSMVCFYTKVINTTNVHTCLLLDSHTLFAVIMKTTIKPFRLKKFESDRLDIHVK